MGFPDTCKYCIVSTSSQWREAGGLGPAPTKRRKQMDHRTAPQSLLAAGLSRPPRPTDEEIAIRWRTSNIRTTSRQAGNRRRRPTCASCRGGSQGGEGQVGAHLRTAQAGPDHSESGQHYGSTEESQDQPGDRHHRQVRGRGGHSVVRLRVGRRQGDRHAAGGGRRRWYGQLGGDRQEEKEEKCGGREGGSREGE